MKRFVLIALILFTTSPVFAGDKIYTEDDLEKYRHPSDLKPDKATDYRSPGILDRISYFDITDIDLQIDQLNEKIENSRKNERIEIFSRCRSTIVMPHPRFPDEAVYIDIPASYTACQEAISSKYENYREKLSEQISILRVKQQRLRELYEIQEQKERSK